jgi:hypothetical protein
MYFGSWSWKKSIRLSLSMLYAQQVSAFVSLIVPAMSPRAFRSSARASSTYRKNGASGERRCRGLLVSMGWMGGTGGQAQGVTAAKELSARKVSVSW